MFAPANTAAIAYQPSKGGFRSVRIYKVLANRRVWNPPLEGREATLLNFCLSGSFNHAAWGTFR